MNFALPLLFLALPALAPAGDPHSTAELVTRSYELGTTTPEVHFGQHSEVLAPYLLRNLGDRDLSRVEVETNRDAVAALVLEVFRQEFQYEGRVLELDETGRMHVTAPAALHTEITNLLAFLEQATRRTVDLRVDFIERPVDAALLPSSLSMADADALVAGASSPRSARLSIASGRIGIIDTTRLIDVVSDYDVEIAQSATIADPVIESFAVGTQVAVRAAAMQGGVQLALIAKDGKLVGAPRVLEVELGGVISNEKGVYHSDGVASLELPSTLQRCAALSTFVPSGQAAVIDTSFSLVSGAGHVAIVLRPSVRFEQPISGYAVPSAATRIDVLDASYVRPPRLGMEGSLWRSDSIAVPWRDLWEQEGIVWIDPADTSFLEAALDEGNSRLVASFGPWIVIAPERAEPAGLQTPTITLDHSVLSGRVTPESLAIALTLTRHGKVLASISAPIASGEDCAFALGGDTLAIVDGDVEVAQYASAIDPIVRTIFDGCVGTLRATRARDGGCVVDVTLRAHVLGAPLTTLLAGGPLQVPVTRGEYDELELAERVLLGGDGPDGRRVVLGASDGLQVQLELR